MATASVPNTFASAVTATGLQLDQNYSTIVAYINEPLNRNNYAADSGNTNTIVLTFSPAVSAYSAGLEITFKAANTNSGATVINANSLGNKNFIQPGGSALSAGQIEANGIYKAAYNGSAFVYVGQNVLAASQGDMETATSAVTFVSPNTTKYHPGVAKAWGWFNGTATGTIGAGAFATLHGATSVVRVGTGTWSIALSTAMSGTQYPVVFQIAPLSGVVVGHDLGSGRATGGFVVRALNAANTAAVDIDYGSFVVYGDI